MELSEYLPFWNRLTGGQQEKLKQAAVLRKAGQGAQLNRGSGECLGLLVVRSGQLRIYLSSPEGREVTLYRLFARDMCLMSASCVMNNIQFDVSIEAEKDTEIRTLKEKIRQMEKENTDLNEEVKKMKSSTERVLSEAKQEAAVIRENATKLANQKADEIVAEARQQAKGLLTRTEEELAEERRKLASDIEKQITDVSVSVAQKMLGREITPEDDKRLIEESLAKWSKD